MLLPIIKQNLQDMFCDILVVCTHFAGILFFSVLNIIVGAWLSVHICMYG